MEQIKGEEFEAFIVLEGIKKIHVNTRTASVIILFTCLFCQTYVKYCQLPINDLNGARVIIYICYFYCYYFRAVALAAMAHMLCLWSCMMRGDF